MGFDAKERLKDIEAKEAKVRRQSFLQKLWWLWFVLAFLLLSVAIVAFSSVESFDGYSLYDWFDGKVANIILAIWASVNGYLVLRKKKLFLWWQFIALIIFITLIAQLQSSNSVNSQNNKVEDKLSVNVYNQLISNCENGLDLGNTISSEPEARSYCKCVADYYDNNYAEVEVINMEGVKAENAEFKSVRECSPEYQRLKNEYGEEEADRILIRALQGTSQ